MKDDKSLTCGWCDSEFERASSRGPKPKFCSSACRQKAHRKRQEKPPKIGFDLGSDLTDILANDPKIQKSLAQLNSQFTSQISEILASSLPKVDFVSPIVDQFRDSIFTDDTTKAVDELTASMAASLAKQLPTFTDSSKLGISFDHLTAGLDGVTDFRNALPSLDFFEVSGSGFDTLKGVLDGSPLAGIEVPGTQMLKIDTSIFDSITKTLDLSVFDTIDTAFIDETLDLAAGSFSDGLFDTSQLAEIAQGFNTSFLENVDLSIFDQWGGEEQSESTLTASDAAINKAITYIALASALAAALILSAPVVLSAAESTWVMTLLLLELTNHLTQNVPGLNNLLNLLDLKELFLGGSAVKTRQWFKNRKPEPE